MSSSAIPRRAAGALLSAIAVLAAAAAVAAAADPQPTTIVVSSRAVISAPDRSPIDFPGVAKARAGQPLPSGYAAVARDVRITRGAEVAYAALRMACPAGKTWRTGGSAGAVGFGVLDRTVSHKRSVLVMATFNARATQVGDTITGRIYALCR